MVLFENGKKKIFSTVCSANFKPMISQKDLMQLTYYHLSTNDFKNTVLVIHIFIFKRKSWLKVHWENSLPSNFLKEKIFV